MFVRHDITLTSDAVCRTPIKTLDVHDFLYYDKDGFELNRAEQKFYSAMNYPINDPILNHCCWQEPWYTLSQDNHKLLLDHSMFLCRCSYGDAALEQLTKLKKDIPYADLLIKTKKKWGFDFALDAVADDGTVYEVLHVEYDNCYYDDFKNHLILFESTVRHTDWVDAANKVWVHRDQWQHLKGFAQNHWKANFLLGWDLAEYTEKAV